MSRDLLIMGVFIIALILLSLATLTVFMVYSLMSGKPPVEVGVMYAFSAGYLIYALYTMVKDVREEWREYREGGADYDFLPHRFWEPFYIIGKSTYRKLLPEAREVCRPMKVKGMYICNTVKAFIHFSPKKLATLVSESKDYERWWE